MSHSSEDQVFNVRIKNIWLKSGAQKVLYVNILSRTTTDT
jgi:hypothetical protein